MNGRGVWTTGRTAPSSQERARLRTASLRRMTATHAATRGKLERLAGEMGLLKFAPVDGDLHMF